MRIALLLLWLPCAVAVAAPPDGLGTNLETLRDSSTSRPFADPFKTSRPWISGSANKWSDERPVKLDPQGWVASLLPGQIARTLLFWDMDGRFPSGQYIVTYVGQGQLSYFGGARLQSQRPGLDILEVNPANGGIGINLTATAAANPLRDIKVTQPQPVTTHSYFIQEFVASLKPYQVIRFMDWQATNGSSLQHWEQRPLLSDARWTEHGAPVEAMVALANVSGADPWFCMPHQADDNFIREFATMVASRLDPGRKVYVEYSNEVWNSQFPQAKFAETQGLKMGLSGDRFQAQMSFYALRASQVMAIWEQALPPQRLVRVLGSQAANSWVTDTELGVPGVRQHIDAVAIAPYFGGYTGDPKTAARFSTMNLEQLFAELKQTALPEATTWVRAQKAACDKHQLPLIAYEGGQSLVGYYGAENNEALSAVFDAANRDPRMGAAYVDYLAAWRTEGGKLFCHYSNCGADAKWGRWGAIRWLGQPASDCPKFAALEAYSRQNPQNRHDPSEH
jgi:hypothetical protein